MVHMVGTDHVVGMRRSDTIKTSMNRFVFPFATATMQDGGDVEATKQLMKSRILARRGSSHT